MNLNSNWIVYSVQDPHSNLPYHRGSIYFGGKCKLQIKCVDLPITITGEGKSFEDALQNAYSQIDSELKEYKKTLQKQLDILK